MRFTPVALACSLTLFLPYSIVTAADAAKVNKPETTVQSVPLKDLRVFAEIFGRIKNDFVEPVTDKELIHHAIRGMLSGLDPHSSFLTGDEYKELKVGTSGEFGGLGIEVGMEDGFVKIIAPLDGTPAQRAGLQPGDLITRLNDKSIKDMPLSEAVSLMRGPVGSKITLTIVRRGVETPLEVSLARAVIHVASVRTNMLEPGFGYVRISQFQLRTSEDMLQALDNLKKAAKAPLKGLVLDLRNNPGGILNAAVTVSDAFLESGLIVYTAGRNSESKLEFTAGPDDVLAGAPIVVLINSGSASAAEIVAGALQDHKRALVVGGQSFGKGSVQTVIPIDEESALKLTTARYYTPLGRSIQAEGITPDIVIQQVDVKTNSQAKPLTESDLARHLSQDSEESTTGGKLGAAPTTDLKPVKTEKSLIESDYQLSEALNLLKGLSLMQRAAPPKSTDTKVSN